jgi:hypothetical protein
MKITYDVRDSDPDKARAKEGFEKPKPGVYAAKVVAIEHAFAKDDRTGKPDKERPMLVVQYEITDKRYPGSWMWDRVPLNSEAAKWKLDQFLLAFGITDGKTKRKGSFDPEALHGEPCRIRVKDGTYNGQYSPDVGAVLAPKEGDEDEDEDPTVDEELGGDDDDELDGEDGGGEDDGEEDVLYYDMAELASMQLEGLNQVAEDLGLEPPKAKAKSRVSLSKWIFENQPAEPPEDEDGDGEGEEDDLDALGEAADAEDEEAIDRLTTLAGEADLDPDDYDTWAELATALSEGGEDGEDGEDSEGGDDAEDGYDELDDKALKAELKDRNLSTKGTKEALIKRLRQDDAEDPF